jgi:hypothetical protein
MLLARPGLRFWFADEFGKVGNRWWHVCLVVYIYLLGSEYYGVQRSSVVTAFANHSSALCAHFACCFLSLVAIFHSAFNARWEICCYFSQ